MMRPWNWGLIPLLIVLVALAAGCGGDSEPLVIATTWSVAERGFVAESFYNRPPIPDAPSRIEWISLAPGDDLMRLASRRHPPDLLLGGSPALYQTLARAGVLEPGVVDGPAWRIARRSPMGWRVAKSGDLDPASGEPLGVLAFDDPRCDSTALNWARSLLGRNPDDWSRGYARLVRLAGGSVAPGNQPGAALATLERGECAAVPSCAIVPGREATTATFVPRPDWQEAIEGIAILKRGRNLAAARALVQDLARSGHAELPAFDDMDRDPTADAILADLLGATLVEARDELRTAWAVLGEAGHADRAAMWMTQAPPWPPASVSKILSDPEGNAMSLLDTLAGQLAPDADVRAWLVRSWLRPGRLVDGALLDDLASAVDGRLAREPRFRQWLRSEWTAWARQRYRRVARKVELDLGPEAACLRSSEARSS